MDAIRPDQFVTLALFMAVLAMGWLVVRINKGGLTRRIVGGRRLRLAEVTALTPNDHAMILIVDGQEFLVLRCKGAAPVMQALPTRVAGEVAP